MRKCINYWVRSVEVWLYRKKHLDNKRVLKVNLQHSFPKTKFFWSLLNKKRNILKGNIATGDFTKWSLFLQTCIGACSGYYCIVNYDCNYVLGVQFDINEHVSDFMSIFSCFTVMLQLSVFEFIIINVIVTKPRILC